MCWMHFIFVKLICLNHLKTHLKNLSHKGLIIFRLILQISCLPTLRRLLLPFAEGLTDKNFIQSSHVFGFPWTVTPIAKDNGAQGSSPPWGFKHVKKKKSPFPKPAKQIKFTSPPPDQSLLLLAIHQHTSEHWKIPYLPCQISPTDLLAGSSRHSSQHFLSIILPGPSCFQPPGQQNSTILSFSAIVLHYTPMCYRFSQ